VFEAGGSLCVAARSHTQAVVFARGACAAVAKQAPVLDIVRRG
jgi:hypothetical protein